MDRFKEFTIDQLTMARAMLAMRIRCTSVDAATAEVGRQTLASIDAAIAAKGGK